MLISALPSLQRLDVMLREITVYLDESLIYITRREAIPSDPRPATSYGLHAHIYDAKGRMSPKYVEWSLQPPSMRRVSGQQHYYNDGRIPSDDWLKLKPGSSGVTHMEFKDSRLSIADMRAILSASRVLKTFVYELGGRHFFDCVPSSKAIRDALVYPRKEPREPVAWLCA